MLLLTTGELGGGLVMTGRGKVGGRFDFIMEVRGEKLYSSVAILFSTRSTSIELTSRNEGRVWEWSVGRLFA